MSRPPAWLSRRSKNPVQADQAAVIVICTHQAALEALLPSGWSQGHCAICDFDAFCGLEILPWDDDDSKPGPPKNWGVPRLLHDCSAWRDKFCIVASCDPRARFWCPAVDAAASPASAQAEGFWDAVAVAVPEGSHIGLVRSKRDRHMLLFFLDQQGWLWHCASSMVVSTDSSAKDNCADQFLPLTLAPPAQVILYTFAIPSKNSSQLIRSASTLAAAVYRHLDRFDWSLTRKGQSLHLSVRSKGMLGLCQKTGSMLRVTMAFCNLVLMDAAPAISEALRLETVILSIRPQVVDSEEGRMATSPLKPSSCMFLAKASRLRFFIVHARWQFNTLTLKWKTSHSHRVQTASSSNHFLDAELKEEQKRGLGRGGTLGRWRDLRFAIHLIGIHCREGGGWDRVGFWWPTALEGIIRVPELRSRLPDKVRAVQFQFLAFEEYPVLWGQLCGGSGDISIVLSLLSLGVNPKLRALLGAGGPIIQELPVSAQHSNTPTFGSAQAGTPILRAPEEAAAGVAQTPDYWGDINLFNLAMQEQEGGSRAIMKTLKKEWSRIWPEELDEERLPAFDLFQSFWKRVDQSRLLDTVMNEVLPDMKKGYTDLMNSGDQQKLSTMNDDERREEILYRMGKCDLVRQYIILSENDPELGSISDKMGPFVARFISQLERKVATQTSTLGWVADGGVAAACVLAFLGILLLVGAIKLPTFGGDEAPVITQASAPANFQAMDANIAESLGLARKQLTEAASAPAPPSEPEEAIPAASPSSPLICKGNACS
ncbi:unnamed protein product [Polarella glacialis]|uniref:Uncharacterized protein n=2 Tax=Polarella glacialis TaxID=89957 RepID=A0A813F5I5_POLGL|nr:unnamed protein product [Polarella glacialis]